MIFVIERQILSIMVNFVIKRHLNIFLDYLSLFGQQSLALIAMIGK